jgi:hypothetical protein
MDAHTENHPLHNVRMGSNPIPGTFDRRARMPEWSKGVDLRLRPVTI